jgi:transcriptional regulator of heat shock response
MSKKTVVAVLLVLGMAIPAPSAQAVGEGGDDQDRPLPKAQMEKVRERIETLRMWKLTKALDIDEKTSAQLFPLLNRFDKRRADIEHSLSSGIRDLREALREKREAQLRSILEKLENSHVSLQALQAEERSELKKILTLEQQARFVLFQLEFSRDIRKIIAEARERRHERGGGRPLGPRP